MLGRRLKQLREEKGVTQEVLAEYLGVNRATVAAYETKDKRPGYEKLLKIADFFSCSIDYLVGRTDDIVIAAHYEGTKLPEVDKELEDIIERAIAIKRALKNRKE